MSDQRLPLPVGSPHPVRRWQRAWNARIAPRGRSALAVVGIATAGLGAYLGAVPPSVTVGLDSAGYHVGTTTFPPRGGGAYAGAAGAVVIAADSSGRERASASTHLDGAMMLGSCTLPPGGTTERCTFHLGGRDLGATDRLRDGGWDRHYDDGASVRISLEGRRPVPVPFALGR